MNIYINIEISVRELDGKLLLGTIAAARGHNVIISDMSGIDRGLRNNLFAPGIYHSKCITPFDAIINAHQTMIDNGFVITSLDEEAGLQMTGYDEFSKTRYSEKTIEQSSAVFCWGKEDFEMLKRIYPKHASKIHMTCSPRVDLWRSSFNDYWGKPNSMPKRPFLLISSNAGYANHIKPFYEFINFSDKAGYYKREPKLFEEHFGNAAEDYLKIYYFIEAIKYLSKNNNGYDIVLRPHPSENIQAWEVFLGGIPNVHVIQEGSITPWINKSFAVMHNGCTTGFEATVSNKPLITFVPFKPNYHPTLSNELGLRVETLKELLKTVNDLFSSNKDDNDKSINKTLSNLITDKLNLEDELAAEKIVKIWESLGRDGLSKTSNFKAFQFLNKLVEFRDSIGFFLRKIFPEKLSRFRKDLKFTPFEKDDIYNRVNRLRGILGIQEKIECKLLAKRTILIKPNNLT